jgi:putative transposase
MTVYLQSLLYTINRNRIRRLMKFMNIKVIYPHSNTSKPDSDHQKYPYLLRDVVINKANQVWSTDITYIPMKRGFMRVAFRYCMAIIDWHTRSILHWSLSNTMEASWCTQVLKDCLDKHDNPEIFNTDQGSQFTANIFIEVLLEKQIKYQ